MARVLERSLVVAAVAMLSAETGYRANIEQWRVNHEAELKSENGWLSVSGLFWLKAGANTAGSESSNAIVLPRGLARAGVFDFEKGKATFHSAPGVAAKLNGQPVSSATVKPDSDGPPDKIEIAGLTLTVIHRGDRYGIRLRDPQSRKRLEFSGLHWFPVDEKYRVKGRFVAYEKPKTIQITNVLGQTEPEPTPGYVEFTLNGRVLRLEPVEEDHQLFFIFRDLTAGRETYPAGRFLYAEWPKNGEVELDFNKAENPPCAFTAYATCPLPPKQNHLDVRVEAGEKNYGTH
ncbi:MAG TPA: DUF1684 domain-containing protein [Bryobacteraceae bacterium]|nr:DUF1684 domain-containing protein [Bryobacteraceae bacterium]